MAYLIYIYELYCQDVNNIKEPPEVITRTTEYKNDNDVYTEFISYNIDECDNNILTNKTLWDLFKTWHKDTYINKPIPKKTEFDKLLPKTIINIYKKVEITKSSFKHIKLKEKEEPKEIDPLDG